MLVVALVGADGARTAGALTCAAVRCLFLPLVLGGPVGQTQPTALPSVVAPTAVPTASVVPTATPTPNPCVVPNLTGLRLEQAVQIWEAAGFTGRVLASPGLGVVRTQSLQPGITISCASDKTLR